MSDDWFNQNWLLAIVATINVLFVVRQLHDLQRKNKYDILSSINERMRSRFGKSSSRDTLYALVDKRFRSVNYALAQNQNWHELQLTERLKIIDELTHTEWQDDFEKHVRPIVNTFSDIASFCENGVVPVRQFLASHHLTILREGWIVEPYILHYTIVKSPGRWGMRALQLLDAARQYHDMSTIHKGAVYVQDSNAEANSSVGFVWTARPIFILYKPIRLMLWWVNLLPSISNRNKHKQQRMIEKIKLWLVHNRRIKPVNGSSRE